MAILYFSKIDRSGFLAKKWNCMRLETRRAFLEAANSYRADVYKDMETKWEALPPETKEALGKVALMFFVGQIWNDKDKDYREKMAARARAIKIRPSRLVDKNWLELTYKQRRSITEANKYLVS